MNETTTTQIPADTAWLAAQIAATKLSTTEPATAKQQQLIAARQEDFDIWESQAAALAEVHRLTKTEAAQAVAWQRWMQTVDPATLTKATASIVIDGLKGIGSIGQESHSRDYSREPAEKATFEIAGGRKVSYNYYKAR